MRFAIINDMHIGPPGAGYYEGVQRKLVSESERLVKQFVGKMNDSERPKFVVNLGDSIEDVNNRADDIKEFKKAIKLLSPLEMPVYHLIGNHDVKTLSHKEVAKIFGYEQLYYSFDYGKFHFVILSFEITGNHQKDPGDIAAVLPKEQVQWLKQDLKSTKKPTVVFEHYGLADDDMVGNFWFSKQPDKAHLSNKLDVRKVLEDSEKVKAVFTAHQHWNRMFVHNGIPYFTVTSLVENFNNDGVASEAHTIVNLTKRRITVDVKGNDPVRYLYRFWPRPITYLLRRSK
ncbi:hypothetical protein A3E49_03890 [Candidatus Saccharibacteria bacterium RIFCSPHIGHO2_12_FULL_49_19]|nr:MAG: hypothetical protein A3E49_03890 [Candidatus Saccharibacteria bacterium RIFCSPHIGHO2_12_FULL_49_19]OGL37669.1 MAG: hypothetical protein A3B63_03055 [Candidatus Saccharibacteria bacterium RIFCSPLOWO2_01_FULL_49_22]